MRILKFGARPIVFDYKVAPTSRNVWFAHYCGVTDEDTPTGGCLSLYSKMDKVAYGATESLATAVKYGFSGSFLVIRF